MNFKQRFSRPVAAPADTPFLPDFCDIRLVFGVVLMAELLAFILVLASAPHDDPWTHLGLVSLFIQWVALTSAAVLCGLRRLLPRLSHLAAALISYLLLLLVTLVLSDLAYRALTPGGLMPMLPSSGHFDFVLRNLCVGAIIHALVLRYLFIQHQWKQQVLAEALARLQALRARIRPHFLFNSLNTIAALIRSRPQDAEEAVQDLADLFRATLSDARERVRLEEELEITRQYIQLEALRLGDRLQVDWQIPEQPLTQLIPSLILQPLVENAIYHGIEPLPAGGTIKIQLENREQQVHMLVSNPLPNQTRNPHAGNQIALDNIRQRLELAYGEEAGLEITQEDGQFCVELYFPWETTP